MTTIHAANDPGFYIGSLINQNPHSGDILWMLKSAFKTAGWTVFYSGDGDAIVSASDILTNKTRNNNNSGNSPKIANSICNDLCWFILQTPNANPENGQLLIQLVQYLGGSIYIRAKWSVGGFDVTGSPGQVPGPNTPGDEQIICGRGPDSFPVGDPILPTAYTEYSYRFNMGIDDNSATPRAWMTLWANGSKDNVSCLLFIDYLLGLKGADTNPYIAAIVHDMGFLGGQIAPFNYLGQYTQIDLLPTGVATRFGTTLTHKMSATAPGLAYADTGPNVPYPRSLVRALGKNTVAGKECMAPMLIARHSSLATPNGIKGYSSYLFWSLKDMSLADHLDVTGVRDYVYIGDLLAPWNSASKCAP